MFMMFKKFELLKESNISNILNPSNISNTKYQI